MNTENETDAEALEYYLDNFKKAPDTEAEKAMYLRGKELHKGGRGEAPTEIIRENYEDLYIGPRGIGAVYQIKGQWHSLRDGKSCIHASLNYAMNHLLKEAKVLP